jgi:hypothetical protein
MIKRDNCLPTFSNHSVKVEKEAGVVVTEEVVGVVVIVVVVEDVASEVVVDSVRELMLFISTNQYSEQRNKSWNAQKCMLCKKRKNVYIQIYKNCR